MTIKLTGSQLQALRETAEWTQAEMGKAQGFEQPSIANMEAGRRSIPFDLDTAKTRMIARLMVQKGDIEEWLC